MPIPHCKLNASSAPFACQPPGYRCALALLACAAWPLLTGCTAGALSPVHMVSLAELESAEARPPCDIQYCFVADPAALESLVHPLGRRLALLEVKSPEQWRRLAQAVPNLGPCPNLNRGSVVGLLGLSGTPVEGGPPFHVKAIRLHDGAGLLEARFNSGSYLPDGTTYLETTYVPGLRSVLVVNVDGVEYVAEQQPRKSLASRTAKIH